MTEVIDEKKEAARRRQKKYATMNKEKVLAASKKWNQENKQKMLDASMRHFNKIKDDPLFRSKKAEMTREWSKKNPEKVAQQSAKKRAEKIKRMPKWLTDDEKTKIKQFYKIARMMTSSFGKKYHVDHIVPLKGKLVSGLHVPWNLTVLKAEVNMQKSNKFSLENSNG